MCLVDLLNLFLEKELTSWYASNDVLGLRGLRVDRKRRRLWGDDKKF
jgi:hypothetical protein